MIKRFKCWLFGHDWVQKGFSRIRDSIVNNNGDEVEGHTKDHLLYFCRRCHELNEIHLDTWYADISEQAPIFAECFDEDEE